MPKSHHSVPATGAIDAKFNRALMAPSTPVDSLLATFEALFGRRPSLLVRAPGRANLLGAHVDYSEGWVLPAAINRDIWLAAAPADQDHLKIYSADFDETAIVVLDTAREASQLPHWSNYAKGVVWSFLISGYKLVGCEAAVMSDLPMAAGLSSSAALEMALVLACQLLSDLELDPLSRARLGQKAENEYLGVGSGIMDQFACVHGREGQLILLDCRTLEHQYVPVAPTTAIILADSGVRRELATIDYNRRPEECRAAAALLEKFLPGMRTLRDVSMEEFDRYAGRLPPLLRRRA